MLYVNVDVSLWDPDNASSLAVVDTEREKNVKVHSMSTVQTSDDEEHGPSDLEIDDHSAMSVTAGLVRPPIGGAWQYVVDRSNWAVGPYGRGTEVTVHCRSSSKKISVDPTCQLEVICRLEGLIRNKATHVVVAVTYGLEAFCVFSQNLTARDEESVKKMRGYAQFFANGLSDGKSRLEPGTVPQNLQCIFYSDLIDGQRCKSQSIADQYEACRMVLNHQVNKAIPLEVVLYPIRKLTEFGASKMPANQMGISRHLVTRFQFMWDRWQQARVQSDSLIKELDNYRDNSTSWNYSSVSKRVQDCNKSLKRFSDKILKVLSEWVVSTRRGEGQFTRINEDQFIDMMQAIDGQSPFASKELIRWINDQKQQVHTLEILTTFEGVQHISGAKQVLDREIKNGGDDWFAVVLHIPNLTGQSDNLLQDMNRYSDAFNANQQSSWVGRKNDSKPAVNFRRYLNAGQEFSDWVTCDNYDTTNVHYIIFYDDRVGQNPFIRLYRCGTNDSMVINIPRSPGKVVVDKKRLGVTLSWAPVETDNFVGYFFQYRNVNRRPKEQWKSIENYQSNTISYDIGDATNSAGGLRLHPEESYIFRVATVVLGGRSQFGPDSDEVTIAPVCQPPQNVEIKRVTDSIITLAWDQNQEPQNPIRITSYSADCWEDGSEDSMLIQRTTTANEVAIEPLERDTDYCVQIRAVCTDAKGSTFYGPACPVLKIRTQREAERPAQVVRRAANLNQSVTKSDIDTFNLPLKAQHDQSQKQGVGHYVFGELSYLALAGKRRQRTILVLGATGSGKSTLINAMANYILGVKWEDNFRLKLIDEPAEKSQAHSQTDDVTTYDLHYMQGSRLEYSLTVVDTPGFGDTRGIERDREIKNLIENYFKSRHGVQQLEAICFVVQSSESRLTKTQRYIFDSILSLFGNDIKDNIRIMVTFADNEIPPVLEAIKVADIPSPVDPKTNLPLHHKFNSNIFFTGNRSDVQTDDVNQIYFDMAVEGFDRFFDDLSRMETKSLAMTREVLEERKKLEALIEGLQMRTEIKLTNANQLDKIKKLLTENKEQMEANKDFDVPVEYFVPKSIDISGTGQFTTNCQNCQRTCHFPCRQADDKDKNKCSVMDKANHCRICNCSWNVHHHQKYRYEMVKETKMQSFDSIRKLYEGAAEKALSNEELLDKIQKDIDEDEKQLLELMQATSPHIRRLDEIALRPHPESTTAYIDLMIEAEKRDNRPGFQERIAKLQKLRQMSELNKTVVEHEKSPKGPKLERQSNSVDLIDMISTVEQIKTRPSFRNRKDTQGYLRQTAESEQSSEASAAPAGTQPTPPIRRPQRLPDLMDGLDEQLSQLNLPRTRPIPNAHKLQMKSIAEAAKLKRAQMQPHSQQ